ncbi:MAG: 16S rRNA (guanine(966)-N(2))-methyltransferase RsmD [Nocardioidaceae bacterium]
MTRIIGGVAGGRPLATPGGNATRPTSDRVREAVFSTLESLLGSWSGRRFLDLFAGSGAVGLEAVSRGAAHATLVENSRRVATVARTNVRSLGFAADVVQLPAGRYLRQEPKAPYDVVFLDPPYSDSAAEIGGLVETLVLGGWLTQDAVVVVERPTGTEFGWPNGVTADRAKRYGATTVWYGRAS